MKPPADVAGSTESSKGQKENDKLMPAMDIFSAGYALIHQSYRFNDSCQPDCFLK